MHKRITSHFQKVDTTLFLASQKIQLFKPLENSKNYFANLCEAIINQQLSDKAAATIFKNFKKLFPRENITAKNLLNIPDTNIRNVGTSWKKVNFMKNLAEKVINKKINLEKLGELNNEEVILELTKLYGIGRWTAEMFLMFSLAREDVFSAGDLGLRRAIQKLYQLRKEPTEKQIERISKKWSPYRTYAALILWHISDN